MLGWCSRATRWHTGEGSPARWWGCLDWGLGWKPWAAPSACRETHTELLSRCPCCRQYSKQYVPLEGQAREARRGIWAGTFQQPRDWRRENKHRGTATPVAAPVPPVAVVAAPAAVPAPAAPCVIKGNITGRGKKIYHLPGSRSYDATVIDSSKGERLFCTVAEAEAAGWRAVI